MSDEIDTIEEAVALRDALREIAVAGKSPLSPEFTDWRRLEAAIEAGRALAAVGPLKEQHHER